MNRRAVCRLALALAVCLSCGGKATPPDPSLFVGHWVCPSATAATGYIGILLATNKTDIFASNGEDVCSYRYVISGSTATASSCGEPPSGQLTGCNLLCGTLTVNGNTLEASFTFRQPDGGAPLEETLSCVRSD